MTRRRLAWTRFWLASALLLGALVIPAARLQGQGAGLSVDIARPSEGETFYAGPATLFYNLPIRGWVTTTEVNPTQVEVRLEVFQGEALLGALTRRAAPDGTFLFYATVNPENEIGQTPNYRFAGVADTCGESCHSPLVTSLHLGAGALRMRVTATTPDGQQAAAERQIFVDRSAYVTVPVQVVLEAEPEQGVAGVFVSGATRLYMWRGRHGSAATGADGQAAVKVEALDGAPTEYVFQVEPTVVDGVWYEGVAPVEVTLPAGAASGPAVTLLVRGQLGHIIGSLTGAWQANLPAIPVVAIRLPEGLAYRASADSRGAFDFSGLPVGRYQVVADAEALAALGLTGVGQTLDLAKAPEAEAALPLESWAGSILQGVVRDSEGRPLPFAWVSPEPAGRASPVSPASGGWMLAGLASPNAVVVSAPGFYSRAFPLAGTGAEHHLDLSLALRPETLRLPWGSGEIIVPPETRASAANEPIVLDAGWLWGAGSRAEPILIRAAGFVVRLSEASFALESLPTQTAWLYLLDGRGEVYPEGRPGEVTELQAGSMLALLPGKPLTPVPLDTAVFQALRPTAVVPVLPVWEPSLSAQVQNRLALLGLTTIQAVTALTYGLAGLAVLGLPILIVLKVVRHAPRAAAGR